MKDQITYDTDHKSFVIEVFAVPAPTENVTLANSMLDATRKIESALVQKLNCMYFVARKVSLTTVEAMMRKEA